MGRSKVVVRWSAISMDSSSGSASNNDVGCRLAVMIAGVDVVRCRAREGQPRAHTVAWMELRRVDDDEMECWRGGVA